MTDKKITRADRTSDTSNPFGVTVGQVWRDNDPRGYERLFKVNRVTETHAEVRDGRDGSGRRTTIKLTRFNERRSTGYTLVSGPKANS